MKPLKIGIDLDGVCANFIKHFILLLRDIYGEHLPIVEKEDEIKDWDMTTWYPVSHGQVIAGFNEIDNMNTFWLQLELINPEHWERLKHGFNNKDYEVYFITSRTNGKNLHWQTVEWLTYHGWKNPQVILCKEKWDIVKILGIDYFIDDNFETCDIVYKRTLAEVFLYSYPHNHSQYFNRYISHDNNLKRIDNLNEFINYIKENEKISIR